MSLYFQVKIAKCLLIPQGSLLCLLKTSFQNKARNLASDTAREGNKTLVMLLKEFLIYPWLVVEAFKVGFGDELD
ncbi:hypothetical protein ES703_73933 [subsurface metagenome]